MKLHYPKILLFFFLLNILVKSYQVYNNNEPQTTPHHTPTTTSRVLSECYTQSSNYDNNPQMKRVMKKFKDRTSERLREYDERMREKRQKRKEERDKNIQKIIDKDKMEKSLTEKIEKACLKCGCGLGGGVLPVWALVSGLWYGTWLQYLSAKALPAGIKKGIQVGLAEIAKIVQKTGRLGSVPQGIVEEMLSSGKFTNGVNLYDMVQYISTNMYEKFYAARSDQIWHALNGMVNDESIVMFNTRNSASIAAVANAVEEGKAAAIAVEHAKYTHLYNAIGYSFLAILIIVLVMIIIYLVLRYRRKKKMKKKAEYTKLLNQ
ncbi:rifin PIR protein, putative [Plasmodium reichenowi]|uniref:Rifin PIR protein, putative n=1 Tax=Plasmodium reichenowi TaxID=5854 RepID=A0A2P9DSG4_PLARE|nr:rifin PIR protein, putative [Plasmodium reichenowi]